MEAAVSACRRPTGPLPGRPRLTEPLAAER
jgi:hypothetical protein